MNFSTWSIKFLQKFSKLSSVKSTNNVVFSFWSARWILFFRFIVITWYCIQVIIFYQDNFTLKFSKKFMILLRNYCNLPTDQKGLRRDFDASFFCQSCHFEPGLYVDWFLFVFASKSLCCYRYFSSTYSKLQQIFSFRIQNMCIFGHFPFNFLVANVASDALILITFLCRT